MSSLPVLKQNGWRQRLDNKAAVCNGQSVSEVVRFFIYIIKRWFYQAVESDFRILKKKKWKHFQTELSDVTMTSKTDQLLIVVSILEGKQFKGADYNLVKNTPLGNKVKYTMKVTLWHNAWCFTWFHKVLTGFLNSSLMITLASLDC